MPAQPCVLLLSPGIVRWTDMDFGLPHLVSLGGWLREHTGVRVELLDLNYEGGDHHTLARRLDELGPFLLIGLSVYSSFDVMRCMALARFLKQRFPDVPLVAGGYHASALPHELVFEGSPLDAVVQGEAEKPMQRIVEGLLGGGGLEQQIYAHDLVMDLDTLPPYAWDLLDRYWPRARDIGRKFQVYLSRGCAYHCTFCMERAKSGYTWRAYSPARAIDELKRLSRYTDLSGWVVNLADPLFGFHRRWRREVLEGIVRERLFPRQYWTLTRSDDLDDEDIALLARARFSIGIGLESGSPRMLKLMQKGNHPEAYKAAILRLASLSRRHGLNWATNIIVGHPGETPESLRETHAFLQELFLSAGETCGWLSIDPFRLYPGSQVHQEREVWEREQGAVFYHPTWWTSWYDGPFRAQHLDPSSTLDYATRVRFMHAAYGPLVEEVQRRFRGHDDRVERVFARSLAEQRENLSTARRDQLLAMAARVRPQPAGVPALSIPIGLHVKDPWVRRREEAVRRLLDEGVLRTEALVEALLQTPPERFLPEDDARAMLSDRVAPAGPEGLPARALPLRAVAMGLEALEPAIDDAVADLTAVSAFVPAVLARLVGARGRVLALHPGTDTAPLERAVAELPQVEVRAVQPPRLTTLDGTWDGLWIGAALPRFPPSWVDRLREPEGRAIAFLGPRFRPQDLVSLTRRRGTVEERRVARVQVPVLGGPHGWIAAPALPHARPTLVVQAPAAPALAFHVLAHLDLGRDAASLHDPSLPPRPWVAPLRDAYDAAPGRLALHALALADDTVPGLLRRLRARPGALADDAGRLLASRFADVVEAEAEAFVAVWRPDADAMAAALSDELVTLAALRTHLWRQRPEPTPPLQVLHVPALRGRGRATMSGGVRRVATSLTEAPEHVLLLLLHEEMHPITDPIVLQRIQGARDTRVGSDGWRVHAALEQTAVEATGALLEALAPERLAAFERWRLAAHSA